MKTRGENIQQSTVTQKIMILLISEFNYVVCSIEDANSMDNLTLDELQSSLLVAANEEQYLWISGDERETGGRG